MERGSAVFIEPVPWIERQQLSRRTKVFLPGDPRFGHVSSSLVKEVAAHGGDVQGLVPDAVLEALHTRI